MALPGTELANKVLEQTGLSNRLFRHFTYVRKNDRSYKMWGRFTSGEAADLIDALTKAGAVNARTVHTIHFTGHKMLGGVRFELAQ